MAEIEPNPTKVIAQISAILMHNYNKYLEIHYGYYKIIEIVANLSIETFTAIKLRIVNITPAEFNSIVLKEAKRLLMVNNSIHVP